jgi:hypothetical protein
MSELEKQRLLRAIAAGGQTNAELAAEFNKAASTIYNLKVQYRDEIDELRRKWTVQFEDLWMARKQARLDDIQELRDIAWRHLRELEAARHLIDGQTGEVTVQLIAERKVKVFGELILKANRGFAEETGQLPNRVEGLDQRWTPQMLGLGNGGGIDYGAIAQRKREWDAAAPEREAAAREREAERQAQLESLKGAVLASVGLDGQGTEQWAFERWLVRDEQRLAQGLGPEDEWDEEDFAELRAELGRLFPGDESMRARVERFIESATQDRDQDSSEVEESVPEASEESEPVQIFRAMPPVEEPIAEPVVASEAPVVDEDAPVAVEPDDVGEPEQEPVQDTPAEPERPVLELVRAGWTRMADIDGPSWG